MAADARGGFYLSDAPAGAIYRIGVDGTATVFVRLTGGIARQAFGPDGTLYAVLPGAKKIIAVSPQGHSRTLAESIAGREIVIMHDGAAYVSEPGAHRDMPSRVWRIKGSEKKVVDQGLATASGIAFSPDGNLFFAAEQTTKRVYSYVFQPDGSLRDKQPFYWLHQTDTPDDRGAEDLAVDTHGSLYVATRMGIQVCDQNGRVRAILPLPAPSGPARSLCFAGGHFDVLYVTDGTRVFARRLKVRGFAPWAPVAAVPTQGPG